MFILRSLKSFGTNTCVSADSKGVSGRRGAATDGLRMMGFAWASLFDPPPPGAICMNIKRKEIGKEECGSC
jgi:hypothetical protein